MSEDQDPVVDHLKGVLMAIVTHATILDTRQNIADQEYLHQECLTNQWVF